ncbi:MAG: hypothetical protein JNK67_30920 [Alphaproteobacteria bacterium]|nr:hypothetical protein [Alphaproteobacteria bacterium]
MFVGVDIGTQSLKAVVTDDRLSTRAVARQAYAPSFPRPGWAEQAPQLWEAALAPTIAAALAAADARAGDVRGIGLCSQLDGCVAVDRDGEALGPCLIWMDRRATAETADVPADLVRRLTGIARDAGHMGAKIRWLKRNGGARGAARFHQPVSYVVERLTGAAVIDHALASTSMLCALAAPRYEGELLARFEIDAAELPRIAAAAACAGRLHARGARLAGLPEGVPVAVGTGDDFATMLGAGLVAPGRVGASLGTGEVVGALHPAPLIDDEGLVETHAYPAGGYFIENPGWLSGGAVAWLTGILGLDRPAALDDLAATAPPGSDGLLFLPCLSGAMAPRWNEAARGCFYGLTAAHGRAHMARALLEGTSFAMRDVVDRLTAMGVRTDSLLLLGGGARSRLWTGIRADVTRREAATPADADTAPKGAALLGAVAADSFSGIAEAAAAIAADGTVVAPDRAHAAVYDDAYASYRRLFDQLEPLFR